MIRVPHQQTSAGNCRIIPGLSLKRLKPRQLGKLVGSRLHQGQLPGIRENDQVAASEKHLAVAVTPDLTARFNAADLAKAAVLAMGGQGAGGRPDFAQGGAPDDSKADEGLAAVRAALAG